MLKFFYWECVYWGIYVDYWDGKGNFRSLVLRIWMNFDRGIVLIGFIEFYLVFLVIVFEVDIYGSIEMGVLYKCLWIWFWKWCFLSYLFFVLMFGMKVWKNIYILCFWLYYCCLKWFYRKWVWRCFVIWWWCYWWCVLVLGFFCWGGCLFVKFIVGMCLVWYWWVFYWVISEWEDCDCLVLLIILGGCVSIVFFRF